MPTNEEMAIEYYRTGAIQTAKNCPKPKYTPKTICLPRTVRGLSFPGEPRTIAKSGEYEAHINPLGAVSVQTDNGLLGVMLDEFEVIEWQFNPHACQPPSLLGD